MFQNIFTYFSQLMPDYLQTCKVWGSGRTPCIAICYEYE